MATRKPSSSSLQPLSQTRAEAGKRGGESGKGEAKARSSEQARAAVNARWDKYRRMIAARMEDDPPPAED